MKGTVKDVEGEDISVVSRSSDTSTSVTEITQ
jgi:hypothetical protein